MNIHTPAGRNKQGWHSFLSMRKGKYDASYVDSSRQQQRPSWENEEQNLFEFLCSCRSIKIWKTQSRQTKKLEERQGTLHFLLPLGQKGKDMFNMDVNSSLMMTKLLEFYSSSDIKSSHEDFFPASISINPYLADKALFEINKKTAPDFSNGKFHLKIEHQ